MSHPKDEIDETQARAGGMALVDLLYGDLSDDEREQATASLLEEEPDLESDLEALTSLRALFHALPDEEPPASVTAKLMHAAALHAPKQASAAETKAGKTGLLSFLAGLFRPIAMHPGLAAAASMVLIVLVGGTIYMNGKSDGLGEPEVIETPARPAIAPEGAATGAFEGLEEASLDDQPASEQSTTADQGQGEPRALEQKAETPDLAANRDREQKVLLGDELDGKLDKSSIAGGVALDGVVADKRSGAGKRSRRTASKGSSARTGGYYDGEHFSTEGGVGASNGSPGSATGSTGAPIVAQTRTRSTPVATPAPEPTEAEAAEDRSDASKDDDMAAEAAPQAPSQAPPPPPAKKPAPKSEPRQERPNQKKTKAQDPARDENNNAARVRSLHSEARVAASRGDCKTVADAGRMIQALDARYYKSEFLEDRALARCMAQKAF